jgi:WD40 repeat protein
MSHCPPADTLNQLLADRLPEPERAAVETHVEDCAACQETLDRLSLLAAGPAARLFPSWRPDDAVGTTAEGERFLEGLKGSPLSIDAATSVAGPTDADPSDEPPRVDGYDLLDELGRGGMGIVFKAHHLGLNRSVALKMVLAGPFLTPVARSRLRREARAVARLQHPNIVQVYDVGEQDGRPFFSMELVEGGTLARRFGGRACPPRESAHLVELLARAIHYAHANGVLHRDLKPGNVLLTEDGTPKVCDFGLAKDLVEPLEAMTQTGALIGTPAYMAPEQAVGRGEAIGPGVDVYSLGAILYELLAGRPPFQAATPFDTLVRVVHEEPPSLALPAGRGMRPTLPRDLATICLKCLEKSPSRRYATAGALADDLRRFLDGQPIVARPVGVVGRLARWSRRKPALAGLLAALAFVVVTAFVIVLGHWREAVSARGKADALATSEAVASAAAAEQRDAAAAARRRAERATIGLVLDRGLAQCDRGETAPGLLWLARGLSQSEATGATDLEPAFRANLAAWAGRLLIPRESPKHGASVTALAVGADNRIFAGTWANKWNKPGPGETVLWDTDGWKPLFDSPPQHAGPVVAVVLSSDGRALLTASLDGTARIWDAGTGQPRSALFRLAGPATAVAFSPDGRWFVTGGWVAPRGGQIQVWDTATGKLRFATLTHPGPVSAVAVSPDGRTIVTGCAVCDAVGAVVAGEAHLWDAETGNVRGRPLSHADNVAAVAISPDGRTVLTGCADTLARLWDIESGRHVGQPQKHPYPVLAAAFSPDGKAALTGGGTPRRAGGAQDGAQLWDVATGKILAGPLPHPDWVQAVAFRDHGRSVATACRDGKIRLWNLGDIRPVFEARESGTLTAAAFASDGHSLLVAGGEVGPGGGAGRIWDVAANRAGPRLNFGGPVKRLAISPDGRTIATAGREGEQEIAVQIWNAAAPGSPIAELPHSAAVDRLAFARDAKMLATATHDGQVRLWDLNLPNTEIRLHIAPLSQDTPIAVLVFSPDGRTLFTGAGDGSARLWDTTTGQVRLALPVQGAGVTAAAFNPNGRSLLIGCADGAARLWNADTGQPIGQSLSNGEIVWAVGFSPTGDRAFTQTGRYQRNWGLVRLWDAATGQPIGPPLSPRVTIGAVAVHPGGRLLATGGWDGDVRLWDAATGWPVGPPLFHSGAVQTVTFDPTGKTLAATGVDGVVRVWAVTGAVSGTADRVRLWTESLTGQELDDTDAVHPVHDIDAVRDALQRAGGVPAIGPSGPAHKPR